MPPALYALAVATFAIGTTEFVVVGLIPGIAADIGVSVPSAGLLVSLYALAITLGTPVVSALTGALPRRGLVIALMAVFAVCNLAAATAPGYATLLASRIVMAVAHGVFFGVGATVATSCVPRSKAGSAVAMMMGGLTVAMVIGVPLGSWIGQLFDWRTPFLIVAALGTVSVLGLVWLVPRNIPRQRPVSVVAQLSLLGNRRLATMYLLTAIGFGGTFVVFTFLSPLLTDVTGVPPAAVNIALLLFGGATVVGNLVGGRLTDAVGTRRAMIILLCGLIAAFSVIPVAIHNEIAIFGVIAVWGVFAFAVPPVMQAGVVATAEQVAPGALVTASGFNIAAFNLGISSGSFIGSQLVTWPGLSVTPYASMAMALLALVIATVALRPQPSAVHPTVA